MGAGKSTLAKKLATHFNAIHIDLDDEIEKELNTSISQIFAEKGESYFREIEKNTLRNLKFDKQLRFISVGGGTPCFHNNMQWIKEQGIVVYLNIPASILIGRLKEAKENRPLIKNLTDEELSDFVRNTLTQRAEYYEMADIIVNHNKNLNLLKTELSFLFLNQD
jgi:shikimate kinase